ncbi:MULTISPECIES: hypothetical protein [Clostridium]|uniref:hypothetical protein n=1 Tax=Clostridium TaxID=1485 RepID=UPI000B27152D|nr:MULTISPECIES: hypothetical protein [Clostridium]MBA4508048.1 hypothetical protein [Clostridium sporogenes]MCW6123167.1 hypothetical protein [Clostridium sporogenes]MDU2831528.1 hypothetical protein [Clostridium botulinum]MDU5116400.1 hypothetical protein [Clostridium botulinum]MDU6337712.1 hypothetical protein [Clostridium sporogenes]
MQHKSEYFDALVDRNLFTNFRDTAKELKVKGKEFIDKKTITEDRYVVYKY